MAYQNECALQDRECINCGECDFCDLDDSKICDNCCKCIDTEADFKGVYIDDIYDNDVTIDDDDIESIQFDETVNDEIE
ncbi:MAG: hypothetical protein A2Y23_09865 [Clostridiales bacterium GWB2_37_7]|nr:MAG: hypothetical protein A2Y23_09865 [Clostridiales bacterium GWB2_37_7]